MSPRSGSPVVTAVVLGAVVVVGVEPPVVEHALPRADSVLRADEPPRMIVVEALRSRVATAEGAQVLCDRISGREVVTSRVPPRASGQFSPLATTTLVADDCVAFDIE